MLTQMFSKLFRTSKSTSSQQLSTTPNLSSNFLLNSSSSSSKLSSSAFNNAGLYDRPPIYSVSTISSCFQQQSNDELLPNLLGLDYASSTSPSLSASPPPTEIMSASSISPSSSTSSSSAVTSSSHGSLTNTPSARMSFGFDSNSIKRQLDKKQSITSSLSSSSASSNKYDSNSIKQIYIAPHCIRYTNSTLDDTIYRIDDESLNEIATEILESENTPPKLQIVFYNSQYFAINNSHLQVYKQLQMCGLITHVQADVLSVETIPYALRQHLLQTPYELAHHNGSGSTVNSNDDDDGEEEGTDEDDSLQRGLDESYANPSYPSNHMVDILSAENLSMLEKEMLVDETYEFGACENCIESEDDGQEDQDELKARHAREKASLYNKRRHLLRKANRSANSRHLSNLSEVNEEEYYENERDGLSRVHDYYSHDKNQEEDEETGEDEEEIDDDDYEDDDDEDDASNTRDDYAGSFYDDEEADDYSESIFQKEPGPMISSISQQVNNFKLNLPKKAIERLNAKPAPKTSIKSSKILEKLEASNDLDQPGTELKKEDEDGENETNRNGEVDDDEESESLTIVRTKNNKSYLAIDNPQPSSQLSNKQPNKSRRIEQLKCETQSTESENLISSN